MRGNLGVQPEVLLGEVLETLGGGAYLDKAAPWSITLPSFHPLVFLPLLPVHNDLKSFCRMVLLPLRSDPTQVRKQRSPGQWIEIPGIVRQDKEFLLSSCWW